MDISREIIDARVGKLKAVDQNLKKYGRQDEAGTVRAYDPGTSDF
jgi:hypothetical protein